MSPQEAEKMVPIAAELIGCVHDYDPADTGAVLNRIGVVDEQSRALIVTLAAMVDPDVSPADLLAWTHGGPVQSRDAIPSHLQLRNLPGEAWGRRRELREEVAELTGKGLTANQIADRVGITSRSVHRHQRALREAAEQVA